MSDKEFYLYVFWAGWAMLNTCWYLMIRKEWEIVKPESNVMGIPWGRFNWLCAVTHSTIILWAVAKWKERKND